MGGRELREYSVFSVQWGGFFRQHGSIGSGARTRMQVSWPITCASRTCHPSGVSVDMVRTSRPWIHRPLIAAPLTKFNGQRVR